MNADEVDNCRDYRQLIHTKCCFMSVGRDIDDVIEEEESENLQHDDEQNSNGHYYIYGCGEHSVRFSIRPSKFKRDEALYGRGYSTSKNREEGHYTANNPIDSHVVYAKIGKDEPRCPQVKPHREQHPYIEQDAVLGYALVII